MNTRFLKMYAIALLTCGLTVGTLGPHTASAQSATPEAEATALPPDTLAVFAEDTNKPASVQILTIHDDGTLTLEQQVNQRCTYQSMWQQPGKVPQDTLDSLTALLNSADYRALVGPYSVSSVQTDCHNVSITALVGDQTKTVNGCWVQHPYPGEPDILGKVVSALQTIRTPLQTLVTFDWGGGFAARSTVLTIQNDGSVQLEDKYRKTIVSWRFSQNDLEPIRKLLRGEGFGQFKSPGNSSCADCFYYSITASTSQGVKTIDIDEAQLAGDILDVKVPADMQKLVVLLTKLQPPADAISVTPAATQSSQ